MRQHRQLLRPEELQPKVQVQRVEAIVVEAPQAAAAVVGHGQLGANGKPLQQLRSNFQPSRLLRCRQSDEFVVRHAFMEGPS